MDSNEGNLEWIPNKKITELNLWDGDAIFLNWLKKNKFFSAKFIYNNGKLENYSVNFY
jgi:8-oxo-dGTP diphosphatase